MNENKTILLTGASGLLGSHILEQGLKKGYHFKVISRSLPKRSYLKDILPHSQIELFSFDLTQKRDLPQNIFDQIDLVINCAALASAKKEDQDLMYAINVQGPKDLYKNALEKDIPWVQISSVATMCDGMSEQNVYEKNIGDFRNTAYAKQKYEFDQWLDQQGEHLVIHPCYMLGKYDSRPSSGAIFLGLRIKKMKTFLDKTKNFVAASDVANALWMAIEKQTTGHFVIGGHNVKISDFIKMSLDKLGMPEFEVNFLSPKELSKRELPTQAKDFINEFGLSCPVDYSKAINELSYFPQKSMEEMINETLQYFIDKKILRIKKA